MATAAEVVSARVQNIWSVNVKLKDAPAAKDQTVNTNELNPALSSYSPTTTPPVKYHSAQTVALVDGAKTIDLTAVPEAASGVNIDGTGMKVQGFRIRGKAGNSALTISPGTAPYAMFGTAKDIIYPAGCSKAWTFEFEDKLADIAGGAKQIDFAGTGVEEFQVEFLIG